MSKLNKANGFPTLYGYACGYGDVQENGENRKSIFPDDSMNCLDIKYTLDGKYHWEQFFFWDYPTRHECATVAEKFYKKLSI